jgi:alkylation response protein AidB-like acyl-CoA dehydrogenase
MTTYTAPIKDMMFVMNELVDLSELNQLPGIEEVTPDLLESILQAGGRFAGEVLAPINRSGDLEGSVLTDGAVKTPQGFKEAYRLYREGDWQSLPFDAEFGGQGLPILLATVLNEMCLSANMAWSLCMMITEGAAILLDTHASEAIKNLYLPRIVPGDWSVAMNLTEAQAGTDLALLKTKAVPNEDHYLISGQKIFITYGDHDFTDNVIHLVLARLPDAPRGTKGISLFLVPKYLVNPDGTKGERNDVNVVSLEHKLGIHGSPTCVMNYGENGGAVGYLVGKEHNGLACMFTLMNHARFGVGLQGHCISERAYQQSLSYARERIQGREGKEEHVPIIKHPDVRRMLMLMKSGIEAMRALCYVAVVSLDVTQRSKNKEQLERHERRLGLLTPVVKGWCTELSQELTFYGIQIHGGMGYVEETGVAQYYRDARISTIYEGTTGVQSLDLVRRKILRDGGRALSELMEEMEAAHEELAAVDDANLKIIATRFRAGMDALTRGAQFFIDDPDEHKAAHGAISLNMLMLMGTVCGGWQMARAALKAHRKLESGAEDRDFYETKIITARFYADHLLPRTSLYLQIMETGGEAVMALDEKCF